MTYRRLLTLCLPLLVTTACGSDGSTTDAASGSSTTAASASTTAAETGGGSTTGDAPTTSGDAGSDSATGTGGSSTTGDPFAGGSTCSREQTWDKGNLESPYMNPGKACKTCHSQLEPFVDKRILIGGTVYATGHEPDLCFGIDGVKDPMFVEITDANQKVTQLTVNQGGNFLWDAVDKGALTFPITARVVRGDQERVMFSPQMSGDCNSCHTENGANGAPGRIVAP